MPTIQKKHGTQNRKYKTKNSNESQATHMCRRHHHMYEAHTPAPMRTKYCIDSHGHRERGKYAKESYNIRRKPKRWTRANSARETLRHRKRLKHAMRGASYPEPTAPVRDSVGQTGISSAGCAPNLSHESILRHGVKHTRKPRQQRSSRFTAAPRPQHVGVDMLKRLIYRDHRGKWDLSWQAGRRRYPNLWRCGLSWIQSEVQPSAPPSVHLSRSCYTLHINSVEAFRRRLTDPHEPSSYS